MSDTHDIRGHEGVTVLRNAEAVAQHAAEWLTARALAKSGTFTVALSGGSTPKRLFQILAGSEYRHRFPWRRTHLFFGDERFVPPDDERSNYRMANEALLSHVEIPAANVHRPPTDGTPEEAAKRYAHELQAFYGADQLDSKGPLFDVVLLGLGENGHTASLFPRTPVLEERAAWYSFCTPDDAPNDRLTLTYPAIASSAAAVFLVTGAGKHDVLGRVLSGDANEPASHVTSKGELLWFIDAAAADGR